jgi:hypothetical protein
MNPAIDWLKENNYMGGGQSVTTPSSTKSMNPAVDWLSQNNYFSPQIPDKSSQQGTMSKIWDVTKDVAVAGATSAAETIKHIATTNPLQSIKEFGVTMYKQVADPIALLQRYAYVKENEIHNKYPFMFKPSDLPSGMGLTRTTPYGQSKDKTQLKIEEEYKKNPELFPTDKQAAWAGGQTVLNILLGAEGLEAMLTKSVAKEPAVSLAQTFKKTFGLRSLATGALKAAPVAATYGATMAGMAGGSSKDIAASSVSMMLLAPLFDVSLKGVGFGFDAAKKGISSVKDVAVKAPSMDNVRNNMKPGFTDHVTTGFDDPKLKTEIKDNAEKSPVISKSIKDSFAHIGEDVTVMEQQGLFDNDDIAANHAGEVAYDKASPEMQRELLKEAEERVNGKGMSAKEKVAKAIKDTIMYPDGNIESPLISRYAQSLYGIIHPAVADMEEFASKRGKTFEIQKQQEDMVAKFAPKEDSAVNTSYPETEKGMTEKITDLKKEMKTSTAWQKATISTELDKTEKQLIDLKKVAARDPNKIDDNFMTSKKGLEIYQELDYATAGKKYSIESDQQGSTQDWHSVKSSFPDWMPEETKLKSVIKAVLKKIDEGNVPKGEVQKILYDAIKEQYRLRDGGKEKVTSPLSNEAKQSSVIFQSTIAPFVKEFYDQDAAPAMNAVGKGFMGTLKEITSVISPKTGVGRDALDQIMHMKGMRDKGQFVLDQVTKKIEKSFDKMPKDVTIDFIDRMKRGEKQATPELQVISEFLAKLDKDLYDRIAEHKPSFAFKDNHFRVLWKKIPGSTAEEGFKGMSKRPLEGSKGFMKQSTLADMSEGIANGGVPHTYNPMTMFKMAYDDGMKYVTAQEYIKAYKKMGFMKFYRSFKDVPEDFVRIDDRMAKVYMPIEVGGDKKIFAKTGEWYISKNEGRLLNNFLSRDIIRESATGNTLMGLKNAYTGIELGLSAFHYTFETLEAVSSKLGMGIERMVNIGIRQGKGGEFIKGLGEAVTSISAPKDFFSVGKGAFDYVANKEEFMKSKAGQSFVKQFPDAEAMIDDLFTGGGKLVQNKDLAVNMIKAMTEAKNSGNYIGAALRAVPALNETLMKPLFEEYIPKMKVGLFLKEHSLALQDFAKEIESGKMTRAEIARNVWDSVENRFGEMNFDNLFWNRNFKTSMQFAFRSVTWKLGNLREFNSAIYGQGKEIISAIAEKRAPRINRSTAWLIGLAVNTAIINTIIQKATTGKWPETYRDLVFPQYDKNDDSKRLNTPTYLKDLFSLAKSPVQYVTNSLSGEITRGIEVWKGKDFYGTEIHGADDNIFIKALDNAVHMLPIPFSINNAIQPGKSTAQKAIGYFGFQQAPAYISQTKGEQALSKILDNKFSSTKTKDAATKSKDKSEGRKMIEAGAATPAIVDKLVAEGAITKSGKKAFRKSTKETSLQRQFAYLSNEEQQQVWPKLSAAEKQEVKRQINKQNRMKLRP